MIQFAQNPPVPINNNGVECNYPDRYKEDIDSITYTINGPMVEDSHVSVKVSEYPDEALKYLYRYVEKTNNHIRLENKNPRKTDLVERLVEEFENRNIDIPDTELTHELTMTKKQAMDVSSEKVPSIIKIGNAIGEYEFGTRAEDIIWNVLTTEEEAQYLKDNFEDIKIENN